MSAADQIEIAAGCEFACATDQAVGTGAQIVRTARPVSVHEPLAEQDLRDDAMRATVGQRIEHGDDIHPTPRFGADWVQGCRYAPLSQKPRETAQRQQADLQSVGVAELVRKPDGAVEQRSLSDTETDRPRASTKQQLFA